MHLSQSQAKPDVSTHLATFIEFFSKLQAPYSGEVLSSCDVPSNDERINDTTNAKTIHTLSHLDDVMTSNVVDGEAVSSTQSSSDGPVVPVDQLSYGGGIKTQSDVEATESKKQK